MGILHKKKSKKSGFSLISISIMLGVILMFALTLASYAINSQKTSKMYSGTISAVNLAEAGIDKAIFCLNAENGNNCGGGFGLTYDGESNLSLAGGEFTISVTGTYTDKQITAVGHAPSGEMKRVTVNASSVAESIEAGFDFAMQVGDGGATVSNNAAVRSGSVHSNSSIMCGNNAEIEGSIYVSEIGGMIDNCDLSGDAHADVVTDNDLNGNDIYYNTTIRQ